MAKEEFSNVRWCLCAMSWRREGGFSRRRGRSFSRDWENRQPIRLYVGT
jgi:hypothetical protein